MVPWRYVQALFFSALFFLGGCGAEPEEGLPVKTLPTIRVRVVAAVGAQSEAPLETAGTVEAVHSATIAARVAGLIEELPVFIGAEVGKGDLLVKISAAEITARVAQAEARMAQAVRHHERESRLLAKEAAAPEAVKELAEQRRLAEAALREAKAIEAHTRIVAPFAGHISQKLVRVGDLAMPGLPLLVLVNSERLQVVAAVPESLARLVKPGDSLPLTVPAAGFRGAGKVEEMAPAAESGSRSFLLKLALTGADKARVGQHARVGLPGFAGPGLMVPVEAVSRFGQMERVFLVRAEGRAELRLVRSGEEREGLIEILSGLREGELVVVESAAPLRDGQPVQVEP